MLALLANGAMRDRVDAACEAPGASAAGPSVTPLAAARQLQLCARVRQHCAPAVVALMLNAPAADATTMLPVPSPESIEREVASFYSGAAHVPADKFRQWAATNPKVATLFAPLTRGPGM